MLTESKPTREILSKRVSTLLLRFEYLKKTQKSLHQIIDHRLPDVGDNLPVNSLDRFQWLEAKQSNIAVRVAEKDLEIVQEMLAETQKQIREAQLELKPF